MNTPLNVVSAVQAIKNNDVISNSYTFCIKKYKIMRVSSICKIFLVLINDNIQPKGSVMDDYVAEIEDWEEQWSHKSEYQLVKKYGCNCLSHL